MPPASAGFAPISGPGARVLILGSLPGQESLRRNQYYAHPRNVFWQIMGDFFGASPALSYAARVETLIANDIAVWDVCAAAPRAGSLDAAIDVKRAKINDFNPYFAGHTSLVRVCFNGQKASRLYRSRVLPSLQAGFCGMLYNVLPSSSPAHALLDYAAKRSAWEVVRK